MLAGIFVIPIPRLVAFTLNRTKSRNHMFSFQISIDRSYFSTSVT